MRWTPWPPRSSRPAIWTVDSHDDIQFVAPPNHVQMVMPPGIPWHAIPRPDREMLEEEAAFIKHEIAMARLNQVTAEYRLEWPPPGGWPTSDSL